MGVLTTDEGLAVAVCQIVLDIRHLRVHAAFHIGGIVITPVVENAFIVHKSGVVQLAEKLRHLVDRLPAKGLVSHRPDQPRGMVFIPMIAGADAVVHHLLPLCLIVRHHKGHILFPFQIRIPCAVGLQITLRDQIQAVAVAQLIEPLVVGIMGGADRIDVVPFHGHHILQKLLVRHMPSRYGAEIVAVRALEYNALSVQEHTAVFHLKLAETDGL